MFGFIKAETTFFYRMAEMIPGFPSDKFTVLLLWFPSKPSSEGVEFITNIVRDVEGRHGVVWYGLSH